MFSSLGMGGAQAKIDPASTSRAQGVYLGTETRQKLGTGAPVNEVPLLDLGLYIALPKHQGQTRASSLITYVAFETLHSLPEFQSFPSLRLSLGCKIVTCPQFDPLTLF